MAVSDRILRMGARRGFKSPRAIALKAGLVPSTVYPKFKTNENWTMDEMIAFGEALGCDPQWLAYGRQWMEHDREALTWALLKTYTLVERDFAFNPALLPLMVEFAMDIAADRREGVEIDDDMIERRWNMFARIYKEAR